MRPFWGGLAGSVVMAALAAGGWLAYRYRTDQEAKTTRMERGDFAESTRAYVNGVWTGLKANGQAWAPNRQEEIAGLLRRAGIYEGGTAAVFGANGQIHLEALVRDMRLFWNPQIEDFVLAYKIEVRDATPAFVAQNCQRPM